MNKTDAVLVSTLLAWITGEHDTETAGKTAVQLAERVTKTLGAGVRPDLIAHTFTDPATRPRIETGALPPMVTELLAACWSGEQSDGSWPGADFVALLCTWFTKHGVDITHPGRRGGRGDELHEWTDEGLDEFARAHALDKTAPEGDPR